MLEKMGAFFDARLDGYEDHQLCNIDSARVFYPFTASLLPTAPGAEILDLGCGTGLELNEYFPLNPSAGITGIDLAPGMLAELKRKFPDMDLKLIGYFLCIFTMAWHTEMQCFQTKIQQKCILR